jgi:hypothetical protein
MPKLTDTQLVILTAAARREDGSILPLPRRIKLKAEAASDLLKTLIRRKLAAEHPAQGSEPSWRETPAGERIALMITGAGLKAIGVGPEKNTSSGTAKPRARAKPPWSSPRPSRAGKPQNETGTAARRPRSGSKQEKMIGLLQRPEGATIEELTKATGWQSHSVRGVMSGTLKKKLGLAIASEKVEGRGRIYRVSDHG